MKIGESRTCVRIRTHVVSQADTINYLIVLMLCLIFMLKLYVFAVNNEWCKGLNF